jgi:hypothetical protein
MRTETVWAFDLGKGSIGEAVRRGNEFLHKASPIIVADQQKVTGLRKPRVEVIVALRQRLGSSQPIVAARLVLIRELLMNTSAEKLCSWKEAGRGLASPRKVCELRVLMCGSRHRPFRRF